MKTESELLTEALALILEIINSYEKQVLDENEDFNNSDFASVMRGYISMFNHLTFELEKLNSLRKVA